MESSMKQIFLILTVPPALILIWILYFATYIFVMEVQAESELQLLLLVTIYVLSVLLCQLIVLLLIAHKLWFPKKEA